MRTDRVVGLDIGTSHVRAISAEFENGRLTNIGGFEEVCSAGVDGGVIVDIDLASKAISRALSQLGSSVSSAEFGYIVSSASGKQLASLNSIAVTAVTRTSRRITDEDVNRVIEKSKVIVVPPDREIIQCTPRSFRVDGQGEVLRPEGMFGNRLELDAHLITTPFSHVQNIHATVRRAGFELNRVVTSPTSAAEAVLLTEEKKLGVVSIDVGEGVTDMAVYVNGSITHTAVIPVGGGDITKDLAASLRISLAEAKRIKESYGTFSIDNVDVVEGDLFTATELGTSVVKHFTVLELSAIIESRMEDLFHHVRRELIKSGSYGLTSAGIVLTGGGSSLKSIETSCRKVLRLPVRTGTPLDLPGLPAELKYAKYSTLVGIALYAGSNCPARPLNRSGGLLYGMNRVRSLFDRFAHGRG